MESIRTDKHVARFDNKAVRGIERTFDRRPYGRDGTKSQRYWMRQQPTLDRLWSYNIVTTLHSHNAMNPRIRFDPTMYIHVNYHRTESVGVA